jgi:hypothetical protein
MQGRRRVRDPHLVEQLPRAPLGRASVEPEVPAHVLGQLPADREHGMQRRERVLEDHRELAAGDGAQLLPRQPQQVAPAEHHEHHRAQRQVEHERRGEQQHLVLGQVVALDHPVDDAAEHADRGEAACGGAVDDQQAHQHRADPVLDREPEPDRRHDRHRARDHRAGGGERRRHEEHHPRDRRGAPAHRPYRGSHQPVDGSVGVRDREQVRDPDEDHEQIAREAREDVVLGHPERRPHRERGDDTEHPHVDGEHGRDHEDRDQDEDGYEFVGHGTPCASLQRRPHELHGVASLHPHPVRDLLAA